MKRVRLVAFVVVILLLLLSAVATGVQTYICTCEGIPRYFLFIRIGTSGCGHGFRGGDVGEVRTLIEESDLGKYISPVNLPAVKGGMTVHDDISGWTCGK